MTHTPEWHQAALQHAKSLLAALQDIERRHDAGDITDQQARTERHAALDAHFAAMEALNDGPDA